MTPVVPPSCPVVPPSWVGEVSRATLTTLASPDFLAWMGRRSASPDPVGDASAALVDLLPYRFDGPAHSIAGFDVCRRRGWAACADAAAILAAVGIACRRLDKSWVWAVEAPQRLPSYSHLRLIGGGSVYDPYGRHALMGHRPSVEFVCPVLRSLRRPVMLKPARALSARDMAREAVA